MRSVVKGMLDANAILSLRCLPRAALGRLCRLDSGIARPARLEVRVYIPKLYRKEDRATILEFLKRNDFAALVTHDGEKPIATHLLVEAVEQNGNLTIYGHMARANPQWRTFGDREVLLIFQGPHTYISATWYDHVNVPTWDYMIVHAYGKIREVQGDELHGLLSRLVVTHEAETTYRMETLPPDFVEKEIRGVVGFAVDVTRLEAAYKMSQNRNDADYSNVIRQLEQREDDSSRQIARAMRAERKQASR